MGVGGMSSLPGWNEWGVRDRGSVPLVVPHSSLVILTVVCQIYCAKHSSAGHFLKVWYCKVRCGT